MGLFSYLRTIELYRDERPTFSKIGLFPVYNEHLGDSVWSLHRLVYHGLHFGDHSSRKSAAIGTEIVLRPERD